MEKYKNKEYLKQNIIGQNRHLFIYGYNNEERLSLLKEIDNENPICMDIDKPMSVYLNDIGFPKVDTDSELDLSIIDILSSEYLSFIITYDILMKSKDNLDLDLLNFSIIPLLNVINRYSKKPGHFDISDINKLISVLEQSIEFYKSCYNEYVKTGVFNSNINELALPFIDLDMFVSRYKRVLNNNSYFNIIVDKRNDICRSSVKAINGLVGSRINKDISMNIAIDPGNWDTSIDLNGQYIEAVHDYGIVELDDSYSNYVKKLKKDIF